MNTYFVLPFLESLHHNLWHITAFQLQLVSVLANDNLTAT
jgi:hypothetical protein